MIRGFMNKVYRSIYNEQTNTWVAVSEITNTQGKKPQEGSCLGIFGAIIFTGAIVASANLGLTAFNNVQAQV